MSTVKTLHVLTPGITELSNYYLVQLMIKERIRSLIMGVPFDAETRKQHALDLCKHYTTVPPVFQTAEECNNFWQQEAAALVNNFEAYEQRPNIQEDFTKLKLMEGNDFRVTSFTQTGIMVLIEVP